MTDQGTLMEARGGPAGPSRPPALEEWQTDYAKAIPELQNFQRSLYAIGDASAILNLLQIM